MKNINTIIWDWNGTLLNDIELCRNIVNGLLQERGKNTLTSEHYKEIFNFPVRDYYIEAGFDFSQEDFKKPADAFIAEYNKRVPDAPLHDNVDDVLAKLKHKNFKQIIISAMEHESLLLSVKNKGIYHYFEEVSGISNHYAAGKLENAKSIIEKNTLDPKTCCLIGDTIHDHEVAEALDCQCILIAAGHQSYERLKKTGREIVESIGHLPNYINL